MLFLAAAPTALEKLKHVPPAFWWKVGAAVLIIIIVAIALQRVAQMNKLVLAIILLVVFSVVGVNWIYERNEPAFMTPIIKRIAPFLPSKGSYNETQKKDTLPGQAPAPPPPPARKP
jgi:glucan phosphoethanolaminetransferase (alkaline phosphatase superfamily)